MKIIFLDIDGVINPETNILYHTYNHKNTSSTAIKLDNNCMNNLKRIINATGALIVISSSWRLGGPGSPTIKNLNNQFSKAGIRIFSYTPIIKGDNISRGEEIQKWLDTYYSTHDAPIDSFIILDDNANMGHLSDRLVQCTYRDGLTSERTNVAIQMLNSNM